MTLTVREVEKAIYGCPAQPASEYAGRVLLDLGDVIRAIRRLGAAKGRRPHEMTDAELDKALATDKDACYSAWCRRPRGHRGICEPHVLHRCRFARDGKRCALKAAHEHAHLLECGSGYVQPVSRKPTPSPRAGRCGKCKGVGMVNVGSARHPEWRPCCAYGTGRRKGWRER